MNLLKWFLYIAAFSAFVGYVFFWPLEDKTALANQPTTDETNTIEEIASENTTGEEDEIDYSENTDNTDEETVNNDVVVDEEPVVIKENTTNTDNVNAEGINLSNRYLIVVGSFGKKSNADRMLRRVKKSGKDGVIVYINGLNRVVTAATDDESDAKNLRSHFTHIYKEQAFILKQ